MVLQIMFTAKKFYKSVFGVALCIGLASCSRTQDEPVASPLFLSNENFYSLIPARRMELAEATLWSSSGECEDADVFNIRSQPGLSGVDGIPNAAHQIEAKLSQLGANTYVVQSFGWLESTQLSVEIRAIVCSR